MTVLEVIQRSTEFLARKGIESPRLHVELLLGHALRMPRLNLYLQFERQLTAAELDVVRELVRRRAAREPLQHIIGSTSFCGLEIKVTPDVLIPRPETEVLAEHAWKSLAARQDNGQRPAALDFGTGSGCIALALARQVPNARIVALDRSAAALAVARENARELGLEDRIQFVEGSGLKALPGGACFDVIASNPPYIPSAEIERLAPEVRDFDPRLALDGGADGLEVIRQLASEALPFLAPAGQLFCEFGDGQAGAVAENFRACHWHVDRVLPDLSGRERILVASRGES